jgi:general secretion pathway protein A
MYEVHWKLNEKPFENTPDPRFIYYSREHLEAATRLTYAIEERKGAAMLTGEYGCGKTVISRLLFDILPKNKYEIGLITNPLLSHQDLLHEICIQLGIKDSEELQKPQMLMALNERFYDNVNNHRDTVIMIDEAQAIEDLRTFEELRLLLNFQLNERFLITLILIGQPELREKINELEQFKQRLAIKYHLNPLNREDTGKYIVHRLKIAGADSKIFSEKAIDSVWENSEGIPRLINTTCDMCLLTGFIKRLDEVNEEVAKRAIFDLNN